jgi:transcriptional regulator with XRE-family HTH domain
MPESNASDIKGKSLERAFGFTLRRLRQDRGLSQENLGFESGYHRTYISLLERGQKSPSLQTIFTLSKALKIEPNELIRQVESQNNEFVQSIKKDGD